VGFTWLAIVAFLRLATHPAVFPAPLSLEEAGTIVRAWLAQPSATIVDPGPRHLDVMPSLLAPLGTGGNLVNDAHLAAIAIEHRGEVVSFDGDFGRFEGLRWRMPRGEG
jgi:hypothetical protein